MLWHYACDGPSGGRTSVVMWMYPLSHTAHVSTCMYSHTYASVWSIGLVIWTFHIWFMSLFVFLGGSNKDEFSSEKLVFLVPDFSVPYHAHICYLSKQTGFYAQLIDYIIRLLWPSPTIDQLT